MLMQVSMLPSSAPEYSPTYSDQPLLFSWLPAVKFSPILRALLVAQFCSPQLMFFFNFNYAVSLQKRFSVAVHVSAGSMVHLAFPSTALRLLL